EIKSRTFRPFTRPSDSPEENRAETEDRRKAPSRARIL
ncbi:uncharacterized, partial [Tachysurus ichikawai]